MGFPRQEYRSGLPFPPPGDLPNPGVSWVSCIGRQILYLWATWEVHNSFLQLFPFTYVLPCSLCDLIQPIALNILCFMSSLKISSITRMKSLEARCLLLVGRQEVQRRPCHERWPVLACCWNLSCWVFSSEPVQSLVLFTFRFFSHWHINFLGTGNSSPKSGGSYCILRVNLLQSFERYLFVPHFPQEKHLLTKAYSSLAWHSEEKNCFLTLSFNKEYI